MFHSSLSSIGVVWSAFTFLTVFASCFGFYMQYWLTGELPNNSTTQFNLFRRCNYYVNDSGAKRFVGECARYASFSDIPSTSWQAAIVLAASAICLSIFIAFLSMFACCLEYFTNCLARLSAILQLISGLLLGGCCVLFAYGWDNAQVREVCQGHSFQIGRCWPGWALYMTAASAAAMLILSALAFFSSRKEKTTKAKEPENYYL